MSLKSKFIEKSKIKYNDAYDYSLIKYINSGTKILLVCNKHSESFMQTPGNHLYGYTGCLSCRRERSIQVTTKSQEQCLIDFKKVHRK